MIKPKKAKKTKKEIDMEKQKTTRKPEQKETLAQPKVKVLQKRNSGSTIAIVALSILLGLSVIFGVTAAFFTAGAGANGDITLGDPVNINITQGGASVSALTFTGTAMPGTVYDQVIGVSVPTNSSDCVVRGKLTISAADGGTVNVEATTDANWTKGEDGYYYYNGVMKASDTAGFVTKVTVPKSLTNESANKTYTINIQIEAIQHANGAASEVWTTAPSQWTTQYGSGTTV